MNTERITESQLVLPSLFLMAKHDGTISTTKLIKELTTLMKPEGMDAKIINGRNDTYFSQKVRNLKSHDTFTRNDLAKYTGNGFSITPKGQEFVKNNLDNIEYLIGSDFTYNDIRQSFGAMAQSTRLKSICINEFIFEGNFINVNSKKHYRSKKLRDAAIEHFSKNGVIKCECCGFEFSNYYGINFGSTCIEMHHLKPIFSYSDKDFIQTIDQAIKNLLPVCPNCHRVIHKNHIPATQIDQFKTEIARLHH